MFLDTRSSISQSASTRLCSGAPRPVGDLAGAATSLATESTGTVLTPSQMSEIAGHYRLSVERSLLLSAIFLIYAQNLSSAHEDHLCKLFFIEMSKERHEKSKRIPSVLWRPWALAYSRNGPYNSSCLSAISKNGCLFWRVTLREMWVDDRQVGRPKFSWKSS